jgi:hypothetical protein
MAVPSKRSIQKITSSTSSSSPGPGSNVPTVSWALIELDSEHHNEATFPLVAKGIIRSPHPLTSDTATKYHIKRHAEASQEAKLMSRLYHHSYQILNVYAVGDGFLVVDAWEETLRQQIERLKFDYTLQGVLSEIALPLVRTLKYLHMKREVSYNILSMDSVGFLSGKLILTDFSKTAVAKKNPGDSYCDYESFDVYCLGKLLNEVLVFLELFPKGNTELTALLAI